MLKSQSAHTQRAAARYADATGRASQAERLTREAVAIQPVHPPRTPVRTVVCVEVAIRQIRREREGRNRPPATDAAPPHANTAIEITTPIQVCRIATIQPATIRAAPRSRTHPAVVQIPRRHRADTGTPPTDTAGTWRGVEEAASPHRGALTAPGSIADRPPPTAAHPSAAAAANALPRADALPRVVERLHPPHADRRVAATTAAAIDDSITAGTAPITAIHARIGDHSRIASRNAAAPHRCDRGPAPIGSPHRLNAPRRDAPRPCAAIANHRRRRTRPHGGNAAHRIATPRRSATHRTPARRARCTDPPTGRPPHRPAPHARTART
jgi:hypothetical protein